MQQWYYWLGWLDDVKKHIIQCVDWLHACYHVHVSRCTTLVTHTTTYRYERQTKVATLMFQGQFNLMHNSIHSLLFKSITVAKTICLTDKLQCFISLIPGVANSYEFHLANPILYYNTAIFFSLILVTSWKEVEHRWPPYWDSNDHSDSTTMMTTSHQCISSTCMCMCPHKTYWAVPQTTHEGGIYLQRKFIFMGRLILLGTTIPSDKLPHEILEL